MHRSRDARDVCEQLWAPVNLLWLPLRWHHARHAGPLPYKAIHLGWRWRRAHLGVVSRSTSCYTTSPFFFFARALFLMPRFRRREAGSAAAGKIRRIPNDDVLSRICSPASSLKEMLSFICFFKCSPFSILWSARLYREEFHFGSSVLHKDFLESRRSKLLKTKTKTKRHLLCVSFHLLFFFFEVYLSNHFSFSSCICSRWIEDTCREAVNLSGFIWAPLNWF